MNLDFRSDTVTMPTKAMKEAMFNAPLGDDVFGEDPTINALEKKAAEMFGMEAGLFCPSGTMTNQIAMQVHMRPGDEVICDQLSHIYLYEGGGIARNAGASVSLIQGENGIFTGAQVQAMIKKDDVHNPVTTLVSIENTVNKGGGVCWSLEQIDDVKSVCQANQLPLHLDGARIFNAMVAKGYSAKEIGKRFDTISICLSKGLGCPVGSVLLGSKSFIKQARRVRKVMGGGMRQAGLLAAAGIHALDFHIDRLKIDHENASLVANNLKKLSFVKKIKPVETNLLIFELNDEVDENHFLDFMKSSGIQLVTMGPKLVRITFHLDISAERVQFLIDQLKKYRF